MVQYENMQEQLKKDLEKVIEQEFNLNIDVEILTTDDKFGDYKSNIAFKIAQIQHKNPQDIAQVIKDSLKKYKIVPLNGFINIWIDNKDLEKYLKSNKLI